ncbi:sigma-70 family RNA polymerase sigma factor [Pyxidicoccus xibeiensis]|uniref:sigma-70 family RNA polymerase sigma factor n=1 Tax=Pyxidicoccus xibeiensis TaxID=2906759 RepID=UPI0020A7298D|nr:sigma-70 family RNA polymerase sigma factor [Pyxidicoccus xibeiensis]MCP3142824.1 sigma-70 family RNA polymerase sigma factor [Pyxidicoccus xibeiensis]
MDERKWLAERFEAHRTHLRGVAYRMLGSLSEAEDAVQESWLHLSRADTSGVQNLNGWLTTVVARVCLDMLRSRRARREEEVQGEQAHEPMDVPSDGKDAEHEMQMADSVGLALLVVLEALTPAERIAFVLHDMFAVSFDEIAPIVGRSSTAARQLASRARRRVQGVEPLPETELTRQRGIVGAFLAATRAGDFDALVAVLDPDAVVRTDGATTPTGMPNEVRGARNVARQSISNAERARVSELALINGAVGLVMAPQGRLRLVLRFTLTQERIAAIEVIADPARLGQLDLAVLDA